MALEKTNNPGFQRDTTTHLLINTDKEEYREFQAQKQRSKDFRTLREDVKTLKKEVQALKELVYQRLMITDGR